MSIIKHTPTNDLISIIIPVYNSEKYLDKCLESVICQSYEKLEIILVNDGSTDNSGELCNKWKERDVRIKLLHQDNAGAAVARNRGLDLATGRYIMFIDSDDYVNVDLCKTLLESISKEENIDCVICGVDFVNDNGYTMQKQCVDKIEYLSGIDAIKDRYLLNLNRLNIVCPWGKLFRKEIWNDLRFTEGMYYEDLDIMPFVFTECKVVCCIPYIGYYYYQRSDSASHSGGTDNKRVIDSIIIREKHIRYFETIGQREIANSVRRKLLDLIITSDMNGWIPVNYEKDYKKIFNNNIKPALKTCSIKERIRYITYMVGGKNLFKILKKVF